MQNYNKQLRDSLEKYLTNYMEKGYDLRESALFYSEFIYSLENTQNPFLKLYREYMISVMYIDAYKLFLYRQKECLANDKDTDVLGQLIDINNLDDLLGEISCDPSFLIILIESCYEFRQLGSLGKINIIKSLSDDENDWIIEEFPIHEQDLLTYDIEINLNHILNYIKNQITHQKKDMLGEFIDAIILSVVGFIRNLTNYDYDNAEQILLEIAKKDYTASKFLEKRSKESDIFLEHTEFYENYSKSEILYALMTQNDFLKDTIWNIILVYVKQEYRGVAINMEEIDDCKDTEVMKKLFINKRY